MRKSIYVLLDLETAMENSELERLVRNVLEKRIALTWDHVQVAVMPRLLSHFEMTQLYEDATTAKNKFDALSSKLNSDLKARMRLNAKLTELFEGVKEAESKLLELVNSSDVQKLHKDIQSFKEVANFLSNEDLTKSAKEIQRVLNDLQDFTKKTEVKHIIKRASG